MILWEHVGSLSDNDYCLRSTKKLNIFQLNGLVLGTTLILTMDDNKGTSAAVSSTRLSKNKFCRIMKELI